MSENSENSKNRPNIVTITVAVVIVVTMLFYFFTFQVRITEKAVVKTFGKPTKTIDPTKDSQPGLYWKWPYPFQDVNIFDSRMRIFTGTLEQIFTSDSKSIILQTYTGWQIDDPETFLIEIGTEHEARATLETFIRNHANIAISKHSFYQILSKNKQISFLEKIEVTVKEAVNKEAIRLGIRVGEFGFRRLVLPESTTKEVSNRMKEERNQLAEQYRSRGAKKANIIRSSADAYREEQLILARARAKEIEGEAFSEIEKEYEIFAKDKELAIWIRKLEALKKILKSNRSTLLLDPSTAPFDLLKDSSIHTSKSIKTNEEVKTNEQVKTTEEQEQETISEKTSAEKKPEEVEDTEANDTKSATDTVEEEKAAEGTSSEDTSSKEDEQINTDEKKEEEPNKSSADNQTSEEGK